MRYFGYFDDECFVWTNRGSFEIACTNFNVLRVERLRIRTRHDPIKYKGEYLGITDVEPHYQALNADGQIGVCPPTSNKPRLFPTSQQRVTEKILAMLEHGVTIRCVSPQAQVSASILEDRSLARYDPGTKLLIPINMMPIPKDM